jgi:DNA-binding NarL/FixJ family response regulator
MRILLVDDHSLFAEGLQTLLRNIDSEPVFSLCASVDMALQIDEPDTVDLVLLDFHLRGTSGFEALRVLREHCSNALITVVSAVDDVTIIREIVEAGAVGFIPKSYTYAQLSEALKVVLGGETYLPEEALYSAGGVSADNAYNNALEGLSRRQREVFMQVIQGKPNKVIARNLDISENTVKAHVSASFRLLGVSNRTEAVYAAAKLQGKTVASV